MLCVVRVTRSVGSTPYEQNAEFLFSVGAGGTVHIIAIGVCTWLNLQ